jgi:hypothetical protein
MDSRIRFKQLDAKATTVGDCVVRFVISTGAVDRDNDTIDPRGSPSVVPAYLDRRAVALTADD